MHKHVNTPRTAKRYATQRHAITSLDTTVVAGRTPGSIREQVRCGWSAWEWLRTNNRCGRVASTFQGGVNALFGADVLISFQAPAVPLHPWAVTAFLPWELVCEGDVATVRDGQLTVGRLTFSLANTEIAEMKLPATRRSVSLLTLEASLKALRDLQCRGLDEDGSPNDQRADPFAAERSSIIDTWVNGGSVLGLSRLIGLGIGLTPAGDDTLVGILGGLEALGQADKIPGALTALDRLWVMIHRDAPGKTSLPSLQALLSAAAGRFCEPLLGLLDTLCQPETSADELIDQTNAILHLGHTSGADLLAGVIAAFEWGLTAYSKQ